MSDRQQRDVYLLLAELDLFKKKGAAFQDLFVSIASAAWGTDFEARRPQGSIGDRKCDGYLVSKGKVFQCYGPRTLAEVPTKKKSEKISKGQRSTSTVG